MKSQFSSDNFPRYFISNFNFKLIILIISNIQSIILQALIMSDTANFNTANFQLFNLIFTVK